MLVGKTERREVPHEEGQWFEFRQLSGSELDDAEEAQTERALKMVRGLDAGTLASMQSQAPAQPPATAASQYDADTLVRYGVAAWSYAEPCSDENKRLLDARTREWAVGVILEANVRPAGEASGSAASSGAGPSRRNSPEPIESEAPA